MKLVPAERASNCTASDLVVVDRLVLGVHVVIKCNNASSTDDQVVQKVSSKKSSLLALLRNK